MKTLFIEAIKSKKPSLAKLKLTTLPDDLFLAYSIQYRGIAESVKKKLITLGKKIHGFSQILGCSKLRTEYPILLVGSGKFHALNLALQNKEIYILEGEKIEKLSEQETEHFKNKKKSALLHFLSSEKLGIFVSTKPGQENLKKALELKKKLIKKNKISYVFLADTLSLSELENFPLITSWINTSCPGLALDSSKIINLDDLEEYLK